MTDHPDEQHVPAPGTRSTGHLSRRAWLGSVTAAAGGGALATMGIGAMRADGGDSTLEARSAPLDDLVPFHGARQAGIETVQQKHVLFAAFDLTDGSTGTVRELLRDWTNVAAAVTAGRPVPPHPRFPPTFQPETDLAAGLLTSRLTMTFGFGPTLFDRESGLARRRPRGLRELPPFPDDALRPEWCGGDVLVQICGDDRQVVSYAFRAMRARVPGIAVLRWSHAGFLSTPPDGTTPRTMLGHKDGTANPTLKSAAFSDAVWTRPEDREPAWFEGGTYLAFRKIRIKMADWDLTPVPEQERVIGRHRHSGAPLGRDDEFDEIDLTARGQDGALLIPADAHVRRVHDQPMHRRSFSYDFGLRDVSQTSSGAHDPTDHVHPPGTPSHDMSNHERFDAGLLFVAFVRSPDQFISAQRRMGDADAISRFIEHTGSAAVGATRLATIAVATAATFAVPPLTDQANAHSELLRSTPAHGEVLVRAPRSVELEFDQTVVTSPARVLLDVGEADPVEVDVQVLGTDVVATVPKRLRVATRDLHTWKVVYELASTDGHALDGAVEFLVLGEDEAVASPEHRALDALADDDSEEDVGLVPLAALLGGLLTLGAVVVVGLSAGRR